MMIENAFEENIGSANVYGTNPSTPIIYYH